MHTTRFMQEIRIARTQIKVKKKTIQIDVDVDVDVLKNENSNINGIKNIFLGSRNENFISNF